MYACSVAPVAEEAFGLNAFPGHVMKRLGGHARASTLGNKVTYSSHKWIADITAEGHQKIRVEGFEHATDSFNGANCR